MRQLKMVRPPGSTPWLRTWRLKGTYLRLVMDSSHLLLPGDSHQASNSPRARHQHRGQLDGKAPPSWPYRAWTARIAGSWGGVVLSLPHLGQISTGEVLFLPGNFSGKRRPAHQTFSGLAGSYSRSLLTLPAAPDP